MLKIIEKQSNIKLMLTLFAIAVLLRVSAVILVTNFNFAMNLIAPDTQTYLRRAVDIINNGWEAIIKMYESQFAATYYSLILAFFLKYITGINYSPNELILCNGIFNSLIGGLTTVVIFYATMIASKQNRTISFFAALAVAVYPEYLLWNSYVLKETINIFMMSLGIFAIYKVMYSENYIKAILNLFLLITVLTLNILFRSTNFWILLVTFLITMTIISFKWFAKKFHKLNYKKTIFLIILLSVFIILFLVYSNLEIFNSYDFEAIFIMNSPGGPFETWGYYERIGDRTSVPDFLGIDSEHYRNYSYTKKNFLSIYALFKYIITDPIQFFTHLAEKFINMWRPVWRDSSVKTYLMMGVPYLTAVLLFFIYLFRSKSRKFQVDILPFLALAITGVTMHLMHAGQIRFRIPIMLGVVSIAGLSVYDFTILNIQKSFYKINSTD